MTNITKEMSEYIIRRTDFKARQIVQNVPSIGEVDDVAQQLRCDVVKRLRRFNHEKSSYKTFITRVINNHIAVMLSRIDCSRPECKSLFDRVKIDGHSVPLHETLPADDSGVRAAETAEFVQTRLANLPPDLRDLATELMHGTPREVMARRGIACGTMYRKIAQLRSYFADAFASSGVSS